LGSHDGQGARIWSGHEYVAKAGRWMQDDNKARLALPARLTPAEREFFVALRRLVDTSGLSLRRLTDMSGPPSPRPGKSAARTRYSAAQWQNWLNGRSLPPRKAVRMLTEALAIADMDAGYLAELWALAFIPTAYPQDAGEAPLVPPPPGSPREELPPAGEHDRGPGPHPGDDADSAARAAFHHSYRQLSAPAARLLRLLNVHPGPDLSPPAAASLAAADVPEAHRALDELATAGLIVEHVPGRFACSEAHRGFVAEQARQRKPNDEQDQALERILDHYLRTMSAAVSLGYRGTALPAPVHVARPGVRPEDFGSDDQARAWCHAELPVVRSLLASAVEHDLHAYCWQIPSAMAMFLARASLLHDFLAVGRIALPAAEKLGEPLALGHAHFHFAHACALLGEVADSDNHLQSALEHFNRAGDQAAAAATLNGMSQLFMQQGDYPRALDSEQEALRLRLALGDRDAIAHSEDTIGSIYSRLGQYDLALQHCHRSLDISRETGARLLAADALTTLAFVRLALGEPKRAIASYMEVLAIYRQAGGNVLIGTALTGLGDAQRAAGDEDGARASFQQALALLKDQPNVDDQPIRARLAPRRSAGLTRAGDHGRWCRALPGGGLKGSNGPEGSGLGDC
jgi:tetratricopeptide (TPR) repeat protein